MKAAHPLGQEMIMLKSLSIYKVFPKGQVYKNNQDTHLKLEELKAQCLKNYWGSSQSMSYKQKSSTPVFDLLTAGLWTQPTQAFETHLIFPATMVSGPLSHPSSPLIF